VAHFERRHKVSATGSIIPSIMPSDAEVAEALNILGMVPENVECAYCGDPVTEWDHLRPIVRGDVSMML
jgi:hypothetical protein